MMDVLRCFLCVYLICSVRAFLTPCSSRCSTSTSILGTSSSHLRCANERCHQPVDMAENGPDEQSVESSGIAVDSAARRRILFSMIATASSVPLMANAGAAIAADSPDIAGVATSITAAAAAGAGFFASNNEIVKSPKDKRKYKAYTLENGLRVLLCSDPSSQEAAAAMDVHVGATSDPAQVQGLAHFCEHVSKAIYIHEVF